MRHWHWFALSAVLGMLLLLGGWFVPSYLRAVDERVLGLAGRRSPGLVQEGQALLEKKELGLAQMLASAARTQALPGHEQLSLALGNLAMTQPRLLLWGAPDPGMDRFFPNEAALSPAGATSIVQFIVRLENRGHLIEALGASRDPVVQSILAGRAFTNTVLFPPSSSAAGQAIDTAIALAGTLAQQQHLAPPLGQALAGAAREAAQGGSSQRFEQALLDLASLGQRFNWAQLAAFVSRIEDLETLRHLTRLARGADTRLPVLFCAVHLTGAPRTVAAYLMEFNRSGLSDLGASLRYGEGGVRELVKRKQRLWQGWPGLHLGSAWPMSVFYGLALEYSWLMPRFAMLIKWLLYLAGGFCLAAAAHCARRPAGPLERPLVVRGFPAAREFLFALGFLVVVLLLSEPFLAQETQKVEFPFRLRAPLMGAAGPAGIVSAPSSFMNQLSLLTLLLFFVLQALIYTACLVKLAEIRRQNLSPRMKLKLLENEEHLFDAGLYLGFAGTIISLILVSLGVIKPSLMAAYSSTSFGIIFVSILKIFNVRPLRRKLILEADVNPS